MIITRDKLLAVMPRCAAVVDSFVDPLESALAEFQINTPARVSAFIANAAVESSQLTALSENMNYSADGLANTWPSRFARMDGSGAYVMANGRKAPNDTAQRLAHNAEAIANNVYSNRMGNGTEASGDGWRCRGSGLMQITGATMHKTVAGQFHIDVEKVGDWMRTPAGACRSGAWYFASHGCNLRADIGDFDGVCDLVNIGRKTAANGDAIGYAERAQFLAVAKRVFT